LLSPPSESLVEDSEEERTIKPYTFCRDTLNTTKNLKYTSVQLPAMSGFHYSKNLRHMR